MFLFFLPLSLFDFSSFLVLDSFQAERRIQIYLTTVDSLDDEKLDELVDKVCHKRNLTVEESSSWGQRKRAITPIRYHKSLGRRVEDQAVDPNRAEVRERYHYES